jgi:hypothetical protein
MSGAGEDNGVALHAPRVFREAQDVARFGVPVSACAVLADALPRDCVGHLDVLTDKSLEERLHGARTRRRRSILFFDGPLAQLRLSLTAQDDFHRVASSKSGASSRPSA